MSGQLNEQRHSRSSSRPFSLTPLNRTRTENLRRVATGFPRLGVNVRAPVQIGRGSGHRAQRSGSSLKLPALSPEEWPPCRRNGCPPPLFAHGRPRRNAQCGPLGSSANRSAPVPLSYRRPSFRSGGTPNGLGAFRKSPQQVATQATSPYSMRLSSSTTR